MTMVFSSADQLVAAEGQDLGTTDWVALNQDRIDQFAERAEHFVQRHVGIVLVREIEVDRIDADPVDQQGQEGDDRRTSY